MPPVLRLTGTPTRSRRDPLALGHRDLRDVVPPLRQDRDRVMTRMTFTPMTFTAIVTAHDHDPRKILGNLRYQTRKADETILLYSGDCGDMVRLKEDFPSLVIVPALNREDWGHEKRALGLMMASSDALGFFNADDSYDESYVERMMRLIERGADAVYCSWNTIPNCGFGLGSSTSGNFVVRTDIGRQAGYHDRHYEADGTFIERIAYLTPRIARIDDLLYFHNVQ
jgi:hypothetical protein